LTFTALRQAVPALSKDADFIADVQKTMRFQPRFEIGEQDENTFPGAAQVPAELLTFLRQFLEPGQSDGPS
jgi:hypothetical protein